MRAQYSGISEEEYLAKWEDRVRRSFLELLKKRVVTGAFDEGTDDLFSCYLKEGTRDPLLWEIFTHIANEKIPFMDISGGGSSAGGMGIAHYLLSLNPDIPCLVNDIDPHTAKILRCCIDEAMPDSSVEVASFDSLDMPLKDNSLDCITSMGAIVMSYAGKVIGGDVEKFAEECQSGLLREVYRVLKSGGHEAEGHIEYDRGEIIRYFESHEKFLGLYTKEHISDALDIYEGYLKNHRTVADIIKDSEFELETTKTYRHREGERLVVQFFSPTGDFEAVGEHGPEDNELVKSFYDQAIYVLRKPIG